MTDPDHELTRSKSEISRLAPYKSGRAGGLGKMLVSMWESEIECTQWSPWCHVGWLLSASVSASVCVWIFLYVLFVEWSLVSCGHVWFLLVVCGVCVVDVCVVDCYVVVVSVETFVSLGYSLVFLYVVVLALLGSVMSFVFGSLLSWMP